jgi:RimJ/RimL family protein N-acetyltransferase
MTGTDRDATLRCSDDVILRAPRDADARALAKHADNREVWINLRDRMPHPYAPSDALAWIAAIQEESPRVSFAIDLNGEAIGSIGLVPGTDIERCTAEAGYWLGAAYWGQGIATSAVRRICRYGFEELGLVRIFATPIAWNPASARVLEKAGFEREGVMRSACIKDGRVMDMFLYARINDPK